MRRFFTLCIMIMLIPIVASAQEKKPGSVSGIVVDSETLEPLAGVTVVIENTTIGDASNLEGQFKISGLQPGVYNLVFRYIGFEPKVIPDIVIGSNQNREVNVKLSPAIFEIDAITVTAGYFNIQADEGVSKVSFSPEELRRSPGSAQEFSRVLTALPSVASQGETSQDILVRGGSPSENGFIVDNIPLPDIRHLRVPSGQSNGPIGIINSELVSDITFSAGGFSSSFGDRLSSFSEITYREGNKERFRGDVGANLAGFNINFDGPIQSTNGALLLSARRSYLDLIADAIDAGGAPRFSDLQAKYTQQLDKTNKITFLNIYGSSLFESSLEDAIDEGQPDAVSNGNVQNTIGLNWRKLWKSGYSNTSVSYSVYSLDQTLTDIFTEQTSVDFKTYEQSVVLRSVTYLRLNDRNSVEFGTDLKTEFNEFDYFIASETNLAGQLRPDFLRNDKANGSLASAFMSYSVQPLSNLSLTVGSRINYNTYNDDFTFGPRAQAKLQASQRLAFNGSVGVYHQVLPRYLISQNEEIADLRSTRANHYIAGLEYLLSRDTKLTLEFFEKQYYNAPVLPAVNNIGDRSYVLDAFGQFYNTLEDNGRAYARGVELLIQKKLAVNFYGLISGSYFRTRYRDFTDVLQNRNFDNQYLISVIGGYRPNNTWELSFRWTVLGGRPSTPTDVLASRQVNSQVLNQNQFNSERLPAYHSLFTRVDRRFFFNKTNMVAFVEIWNVYNRTNVVGEFWNVTNQQVDENTQFNLLPVTGIKFEF